MRFGFFWEKVAIVYQSEVLGLFGKKVAIVYCFELRGHALKHA